MHTISDINKEYSGKVDPLDLELIVAHALGKPREFVLAHPEIEITGHQSSVISKHIGRRIKDEPVAYIVGHKEFYGLDFEVNGHTLIPRPETEMLVDLALDELRISNQESKNNNTTIRQYDNIVVDVGTGSGNIIISIAKAIEKVKVQSSKFKTIATDISKDALEVAKKNARRHGVENEIQFLHGNFLDPLLNSNQLTELKAKKLILLANLPYLSTEIYSTAKPDVKNYEPKSALLSDDSGLSHYEKLFKQIKLLVTDYRLLITAIIEFSPEQKDKLEEMIKDCFPEAKTEFKKDLSGKWRMAVIHA